MDTSLSGLKYNVFEPGKESLLYKIDSFLNYDSPHKKEIIRYIVLMYDKASPMIQFKDLNVRALEAAKFAGIDIKDRELFDSLTTLSDSAFTDMVIDFIIDQNDYWWSMIISNEITFYEYQRAIAEGVNSFDGDKDKLTAIAVKSKLLSDSDVIANRLEGYYLKVFGDVSLGKKAQTRNAFTPERMAQGV